jgi:uncharacterized membrane protein
MSKKMKILILCSLLLNVLLIGFFIGHASHRLGRGHFMKRHLPEFAMKLPEDKRTLFSDTMKKVHLENREIHKKIQETRERALKILTAPEFDETAYQVHVDEVHQLRGMMMQRLADAAKELAEHFNQEERKALAEHLRHPPRFSPSGGRRHHFGPPPHKLP